MNSLSKRLIEAGFSEYEAKAYKTLLGQGVLSANEISKFAEIPQGRVYNILNALQQKGFVNILPGAVKKYRAVNPKIAFIDVIKERKSELEKIEELSIELEKEYEKAEENDVPLDFFEILTSKQSQVKKFDDLIKMASKTLCSFNKKPYATGFDREMKEIKESAAPLRKIIRNGTAVRALFEGEREAFEPFIQLVSYYKNIGEEVRIVERLPLKMLIADGRKAMISLKNNDALKFKLTSMVIDHTDLTTALMELFEAYWQKSMTIDEFIKSQDKGAQMKSDI